MIINDNQDKEEETNPIDKIVFRTPSSTYSFTQSWVENKALNDILVGLIADDLTKQRYNDIQ
ncbi:MAG: hypothetical protein GXY26_02265 [Clostridiales bacterium]|jgi:hypothetical protein|nr:hypothetical protein [Clostridiales bacterium]